jgi:2'-5' RNA ligase
MANESALIIPIPEVEPIVGPLRLQHDRAAVLGVPAHVTLLYPFRPADAAIGEIEKLRRLCASIEAFSFSFIEVRRFPATAYLHPDESERFVQITKHLMELWPDCRPYGGAFAEVVPHLTVADKVSNEILGRVDDALAGQLPIRCVAREVCLITSDNSGMWSAAARLPLASEKD